jgi:pyridoxamine 5'-phosphate oxidase
MPNDPNLPAPDFAQFRTDYEHRSLLEHEVNADPLRQFLAWLNDAIAVKCRQPNAMTLATCTRDGMPSARIMLLKGLDEDGFVFYSNYASAKGKTLAANPRAALLFFWPELERQVRVEGDVSRIPAAESDAYFQSRPPEAKLGTLASPQSRPVASRQTLEQNFEELHKRFPDAKVERPANWGGYRLNPWRFEFWQGRLYRLHDRIEYQREGVKRWIIRRLAP